MQLAKACFAGIILLTGITGCLNAPVPSDGAASLSGKAYLASPLDEAKITVETPSGDPLDLTTDGVTSEGRFVETLSSSSTLVELSSNLPLIVKVTGGTMDGAAFEGTLLGYTETFAGGQDLHINILSTLIVRYQRATGLSFGQAAETVVGLLGIPRGVDLANRLDDANYWYLLDPTRFLALAQAHGGFDAFTDHIVSNLTSTQQAGVPLTAGGAAAIASKAAHWLAEGTGEGLIAWGVGLGMDSLLSVFGYESPTEKALDDIKDQLTQVNETLTTIQSEITTLSNQMTALLNLVQLSWDSLTSTISSLNMSGPEGVIQNQYNNMLSTFNSTNPDLCTPAGGTNAANFAQEILSAQAYDIDQQVYNMYLNIAGKTPGSNGALYDLTSKLVDQVKGGQDPYNAYIALENYFGQLASIQAQGLNLMINAINQPLPVVNGPGVTSYPGTAAQYQAKFTSQMDDEVEMFLACVDRLVVATVDVRSEIVKKNAYMSSETAAIYNRADFVANQLSSKQPSGLIVRLIGDPVSVSDWVTNNRVQLAGQIPTVVTVAGNNINSYAATIPASTPNVTYYLEWTADSKNQVFTFQKETKVSIVKLLFPSTTAGYSTVATPTESQMLSVSLYNPDFQPATATDTDITAYGSGAFHVRVLPTWQKGTAKKTDDDKKQWTSSWTQDLPNVQMSMSSEQTNPVTAFGSCPVTYTAQLKSTIQNGEKSNVKLSLNWKATQDTWNTWDTSETGTPDYSSKQSLECQSTTQTAKNKTATVMDSLTFEPATATDVIYAAQHKVTGSSIYNNYVRQTYGVYTDAGPTSLEIVPTK